MFKKMNEKWGWSEKITKSITLAISIMTFSGTVWGASTYLQKNYVPRIEFYAQNQRMEVYMQNDRATNLRKRIWDIEREFGSNPARMPNSIANEYFNLKNELKQVEDYINKVYNNKFLK
jgi:hypothetical protein